MKDAANKRDAKAMGAMAGELDGACEGCHKAFWYRDQK
jgi:cytochrome c556